MSSNNNTPLKKTYITLAIALEQDYLTKVGDRGKTTKALAVIDALFDLDLEALLKEENIEALWDIGEDLTQEIFVDKDCVWMNLNFEPYEFAKRKSALKPTKEYITSFMETYVHEDSREPYSEDEVVIRLPIPSLSGKTISDKPRIDVQFDGKNAIVTLS